MDKRKQRRLAKKAIKNISRIDFESVATGAAEAFTSAFASAMRGLGETFDAAGTVCRNVAENIQPLKIHGDTIGWETKKYSTCNYAVYEKNALGFADELLVITYSEKAAEKIAEILRADRLEHIRHTMPERIMRRNDVADSLRAAVITAYENGAFGK